MDDGVPYKPYKIMPNDEIVVHRTDIVKDENNYTFYYVKFKKKTKDGKELWRNKGLTFNMGTDLPEGTTIKVLNFYEDSRENPKDKYNPIWFLRIIDYEVVLDAKAYKNEQEELASYQDPYY
jgi:hypothetical protein